MFVPYALVLFLGMVGLAQPARHAVVLTTDIGAEVDDQWALVHLAMAPEVTLRGVVTTHSPSVARSGRRRSGTDRS